MRTKPYPPVPGLTDQLVVAPPTYGQRSMFIDRDQAELWDAVNECGQCGRLRGITCTCNRSEDEDGR